MEGGNKKIKKKKERRINNAKKHTMKRYLKENGKNKYNVRESE